MLPPLMLPPALRKSVRCDRCGLNFKASERSCTHCADLSDAEALELRRHHAETLQSNAQLGRVFGLLAAVLALVVLFYWLA